MLFFYEDLISVYKNLIEIHAKEDIMIRGAMLHDFYLYDWHEKNHDWHGFTHADRAVENAKKHLNIGEEDRNV